ncbi:MAG: hypothetical protein ABI167_10280 [Nitrosospira sp.]
MKMLDMQQTADYLEHANIKQSIDAAHAIIHIGISAAGFNFVLVNNALGQTVLTEGM